MTDENQPTSSMNVKDICNMALSIDDLLNGKLQDKAYIQTREYFNKFCSTFKFDMQGKNFGQNVADDFKRIHYKVFDDVINYLNLKPDEALSIVLGATLSLMYSLDRFNDAINIFLSENPGGEDGQ